MNKNGNLAYRNSLNRGCEWHLRTSSRKNEEDCEQISFVQWLMIKKIPFYHIPNGGKREILEAKKLRRMGVQKGVPDLCIPIPNQYHHGLYIEMKRKKNGRLTAEQKEWIKLLVDNGYCAVVCYGWGEAKALTESYLKRK